MRDCITQSVIDKRSYIPRDAEQFFNKNIWFHPDQGARAHCPNVEFKYFHPISDQHYRKVLVVRNLHWANLSLQRLNFVTFAQNVW